MEGNAEEEFLLSQAAQMRYMRHFKKDFSILFFGKIIFYFPALKNELY